MSFRTHYDNLKVARNAPQAVIRAAYKALSQRYHPDLNGDTERNHRIMQILNASYAVLSNPERRRQHDEWIAEQEIQTAKQQYYSEPPRESAIKPEEKAPEPEKATRQSPPKQQQTAKPSKVNFWSVSAAVVMFVVLFSSIYSKNKQNKPVSYYAPTQQTHNPPAPPVSQPAKYNPEPNTDTAPLVNPFIDYPQPTDAAPALEVKVYTKPLKAPNGQFWPKTAAYIPGYPIRMEDGLSEVTIDNTRNNSDVFVKLFRLGANGAKTTIRQVFIPAFSQFTMQDIRAGRYDIRYQDLDNGAFSKTESFTLEEIPIYNGTQYSQYSLTLYKVANGNMQIQDISATEFQ